MTIYKYVDMMCGFFDRVTRVILIVLLATIVILIMGQVVMRMTFGIPIFWINELTGYAFVYVGLLGAGICLRANQHVQMPLLLEMLPDIPQRILSICLNLIMILYAYHVVVYGYRYALLGTSELSPTTYFIVFWPRLALPIGGSLLILHALCLILRDVVGARRPLQSSE